MGLFIKKEILKFVWRVFVQGELFGGNCLGSKSPGAICGGEKGEKKVMGVQGGFHGGNGRGQLSMGELSLNYS